MRPSHQPAKENSEWATSRGGARALLALGIDSSSEAGRTEKVRENVAEIMSQLIDETLLRIVKSSSRLANHRRVKYIESQDVLLALDRIIGTKLDPETGEFIIHNNE
eukprot:Trichotokara_eunicae@DN2256_c0_g1_i1.p1